MIVRSDSIDFQIVEAGSDWESRQLQELTTILDSSQPYETKLSAARRLRFLTSRAAIQEMARRLGGRQKECSFEYMYGLTGAPDIEFARQQLEQELSRPDSYVGGLFVQTLAAFHNAVLRKRQPSSEPGQYLEEAERQAEDQLIKSIPGKTVPARVFAVQTLLQSRPGRVSPEMVDCLVEGFSYLPNSEKLFLLNSNWDRIRSPELLPALRAIASHPPSEDWIAHELQDQAVQRLLELEPSEGREVLLREIRNPKTALKLPTLGGLEEATLPELSTPLLQRLRAQLQSNGEGSAETTAYLIHRYATKEVYGGVKEMYLKNQGQWACGTLAPMLAYFLRVNEPEGVEMIQQALQPRVESTGCHPMLLHDLATLRWTPAIQELALPNLWSSNTEVAAGAAFTLGQYGSSDVEGALWKRLEAWSELWRGRDLELRYMPFAPDNSNAAQQGLETNLAQALLNGKNWKLSSGQQSLVRNLCVTQTCRSIPLADQ